MYKFGITSEHKTYKTAANAEKAFNTLVEQINTDDVIRFMIVKLEEHNCSSSKYFGRFIPVAIGQDVIQYGIHFHVHVIG